MSPRLSVCMIARDEAESLPAALASLRPPVDEIVVVDTGSQDATPRIARDAGARVLHEPWRDDFAAARNVSLAAARGAWCLVLDADERVEPASWPALEAFLAADRLALGRVTIVSESAEGRAREPVVRLARRAEGARFEGRIHEQLVGCGPVGESGLVLRHEGYRERAIAARGKLERNERLLRLALEERPEDAFLRWQLARTLVKRGGPARAEALQSFARALAAAPPEEPWAAGAARDFGYALRAAGRGAEALALVREAACAHPRFTDLVFLEALLCMDGGDSGRMLARFAHCLELGEPAAYPSVAGVGSFRAHQNLGLYHELAGRLAVAQRHYRAALEAEPGFTPAAERLRALAEPEAACPA